MWNKLREILDDIFNPSEIEMYDTPPKSLREIDSPQYICNICGNIDEKCTCMFKDIRRNSPNYETAKKRFNNRWERVKEEN